MRPDSTSFSNNESPSHERLLPEEQLGWTSTSRFMLALLVFLCVVSLYLQVSPWVDGAESQARLSVYTDITGKADIDGITSLPEGAFDAVPAQVSMGFSASARWFRVEVPSGADGLRVLSVQPSYLDDVRIYVRDAAKITGWKVSQQGDRFPFSFRPRADLAFAVEHPFSAGEVAYVRVKTLNAHNIRIRLLDPQTLDKENAFTLMAVGLYCGVVLVLASASALSAVVHRDRYWAANALFQLCTLGSMVFYFGLGSRYLLPEHPGAADQLSIWLGFLQFFLGALFYRLFFQQFGVPRWLLVLQSAFLLFLPAQILVVIAGHLALALRLNTVILPMAVIVCAIGVYQLRCKDAFLLNLLRLNIFSIGVYFFLSFITHHGWLAPRYLHLYPGVIINLLTAVTLHFALLRRGELLAQAQHAALQELALARQQILFEQRQRREDGMFLGMLLHELRSPLAVISVAQGALERKLQSAGTEQDSSVRNLHRIGLSVGQMSDVLQQVQAVTELEHRTGKPLAEPPSHETTELAFLLATLARRWQDEARLEAQWGLEQAALLPSRRLGGAASLLEMMVRNLLDNALKYSPPASVVQCQCSLRTDAGSGADRLVVTVLNEQGPAGAPDPDRVFKKYYRAPMAHQYSGSGLGLYWVRGVARSLGGDVRFVASEPVVRFDLELPLVSG